MKEAWKKYIKINISFKIPKKTNNENISYFRTFKNELSLCIATNKLVIFRLLLQNQEYLLVTFFKVKWGSDHHFWKEGWERWEGQFAILISIQTRIKLELKYCIDRVEGLLGFKGRPNRALKTGK